jgi:hypothetical protein
VGRGFGGARTRIRSSSLFELGSWYDAGESSGETTARQSRRAAVNTVANPVPGG